VSDGCCRPGGLRCADASALLQSHLDGQLDCDVSAARLRRHLQHCGRCRDEAASLAAIKDALRRQTPCRDTAAVARLRLFGIRLCRGETPDASA
jgi:anti-sigma factor RsiW